MRSPTEAEDEPGTTEPGTTEPARRRPGWRLLVFAVATLAVLGAGIYVQTSRNEVNPAPFDSSQIDIGLVPTDRLEAILDTSRDDPEFQDEIPGVMLVLAERYFANSEYGRAFDLYTEIIGHPRTRRAQYALSLSRVAWIGWLSTGDTASALATVDQSLRIDPNNSETYYIKAQILWCGEADTQEAITLFQTVLRADDLTDEIRAQVTGDLEAASSGQSCR
jgi:tetratricopeptide (TPR) repeat protein